MKTPEEGYAKGWADAIYKYESKQRSVMSSLNLPPLPEPWRARVFDGMASVYDANHMRAYGAACAAAEREAAARICEKYFHSTCAAAIRKRGERRG